VGKKAVAVFTPHHIPAPSPAFRKIRIDDADGQARHRRPDPAAAAADGD
jgi:hypothetical protein